MGMKIISGVFPTILKQLNVPIYATRFTLGLIELKLKEHGLLGDTKLIQIDSDSNLEFRRDKGILF